MSDSKKRKRQSVHLSTRLILSCIGISLIPILLIVATYKLTERFNTKEVGTIMNSGVKGWLLELIIVGIIVLVSTALLVTLWIYRSIATPIDRLRQDAKSISLGELDFTVESESSIKEIEELCIDFEEMRARLKQDQEEKLQYDRESRELIRNISHDLKTPITAVKGYCEGIIDGVADNQEKLEKYVKTIYNKTAEIDSLIDELTVYAKIDTDRMPYNFSGINANDFFADCGEELKLELEQDKISFSFSSDVSDSVEIVADPQQLQRVIHNIVNNSIKYMDKDNKTIEMTVQSKGDYIQVNITDNGAGVEAEDLPKIFDRFYRTDESRNSANGGSGIGLSIVKKIVEDHGGRVWASSRMGESCTISFLLKKHKEKNNGQSIDN